MKFLRLHGSERTTLKMTAMIDVVFQLLIFFLVGMKFRIPEGELDAYLPEEGQPKELKERVLPVDEIRITLRVSQAGAKDPAVPPSVLLDGKTFDGGPASGSVNWLRSQLTELAKDRQILEEVPVIIEAEPHLAYRWVVYTLNYCKKKGFRKIYFAASKRNAPLPGG